MAPRIDIGRAPNKRSAIFAGEPQRSAPRLSFSFQYWAQREFFGLSRTGVDWIVDFFERIKELCRFTKEEWDGEVFGNRRSGNRWHYHPVDWGANNVPIKKSELLWVPPAILSNDDDYPFWQIGLGAGGGRFAGFWEADARFAIVLMDPHHNLQPSRDYGYRVVDCVAHPPSSEIIRLAVDRARRDLKCAEASCQIHEAIAAITVHKDVSGAHHFQEVVPVGLDESDQRDLKEFLGSGKVKSVHDVVKRGLQALLEEQLAEMEGAGGQ